MFIFYINNFKLCVQRTVRYNRASHDSFLLQRSQHLQATMHGQPE